MAGDDILKDFQQLNSQPSPQPDAPASGNDLLSDFAALKKKELSSGGESASPSLGIQPQSGGSSFTEDPNAKLVHNATEAAKPIKTSYIQGFAKSFDQGLASNLRLLGDVTNKIQDAIGDPIIRMLGGDAAVTAKNAVRDVAFQNPFHGASEMVENAASTAAPTPDNIVGGVLSGVGQMGPDLLGMFVAPEIKTSGWLAKYLPKISGAVPFLAAKGGAEGAISSEGGTPAQQIISPIAGAAKGAAMGLEYELLGKTSSSIGEKVAEKLFKDKASQMLTHATVGTLSNAIGFGGLTAADEYLNTGKVDMKNVLTQGGIGVLFGAKDIGGALLAKGYNTLAAMKPEQIKALNDAPSASDIQSQADKVIGEIPQDKIRTPKPPVINEQAAAERDRQVERKQMELNLPNTPEIFISDETQQTMQKLDAGEPVTNEFLKQASDNLYGEYKRLSKSLGSDTRMYTSNQIRTTMDGLGVQIEKLEQLRQQQGETGQFATEQHNADIMAGSALSNMAAAKAVIEDIVENPEQHKQLIEQSDLPPVPKQELIDKVDQVVAENDPRRKLAQPIVERIDALQKQADAISSNKAYSDVEKKAMMAPIQEKIRTFTARVNEIYNPEPATSGKPPVEEVVEPQPTPVEEESVPAEVPEVVQPGLQPPSPIEFSKQLEEKHGVTVDLLGNLSDDKPLTLSKIVVPKEQRGKGIGKQVMQEIVDYADQHGKTITLTPVKDFGATSVARLTKFYKEFGFVENKGKNKDFTTKESMYRKPKIGEQSNANEIEKAESLPVGEPPRDSEGIREGNPQGEETAKQGEAQEEVTSVPSEAEFPRWARDHSTDPADVLMAYEQERASTPDKHLTPWQEELVTWGKFAKDSAKRFGDKHKFNANLARSWFLPKGERQVGRTIDEFVRQMNEDYNANITPDDVWSFMESHPNGYARKTTDLMPELAAKYKELTGENINKARRQVEEVVNDIPSALPSFLDDVNINPQSFKADDLLRTLEDSKSRFEGFPYTQEDYAAIREFAERRKAQEGGESAPAANTPAVEGEAVKEPSAFAQRTEARARKIEEIEADLAEARQKLAKSIRSKLSSGMDPGDLAMLGKIVMLELEKGGIKLVDAVDKVFHEWQDLIPGLTREDVENTIIREGGKQNTGINREIIDNERAERGLSEVEIEQRRNNPEVFDKVKAEVDAGLTNPRTSAIDFATSKEGTATAEQLEAWKYDRMRIINQMEWQAERYRKAIAEGDEDAAASAKFMMKGLEEAREWNEAAVRKAGYEWSLAGRAMQGMINKDYSLSTMLHRATVAAEGKVPEEVRTRLEKLTQEFTEKEKQYADKLKEVEDLKRMAEDQRDEALSKLKAQKEYERIAKRESRQKRDTAYIKKLDDRYAELAKKAKQIAFGQLSAGLDPRLVPVIAEMAAIKIAKGVKSVEMIVNDLYDEFQGKIEKRALRDAFSGYNSKTGGQTRDELVGEIAGVKRKAKLMSAIEDVKQGITPSTKTVRRAPEDSELTALKKELKAEMDKQGMTYDKAIQSVRTRLENQKAELEHRLREGDYAKQPRKSIPLDKDTRQLKVDVENLKRKMDDEIFKLEYANRTKSQKARDWFVKARRAVLLSGEKTLGKLSMVAIARTLTTPLEDIAGAGLSKIPGISRVAAKAPREGGFSVKAEAEGLARMFMAETYKQAGNKVGFIRWLSKGKLNQKGSDLDILYKKHRDYPDSWIDFFGQIHGMIKEPVRQAEFYRSLAKRNEHSILNGLDPSDPMVASTNASLAAIDANRSIMMQDNAAVSAYKAWLRHRESSPNVGGKIVATAAKTLFPIVKVPVNYVTEALSYMPVIGQAKAIGKIIAAKGIENLTPEQADYVMRALKKSTIGTAIFAIGYMNPDAIGGYYRKDDKKKGDEVKFNGLKVFGVNIPKWAMHIPAIEAMQMGATLRQIHDHYIESHPEATTGAKTKAALGAVGVGAKGLAAQVPFWEEPGRLTEAVGTGLGTEKWAGEFMASLLIPPPVRDIARQSDQPDLTAGKFFTGDPIKRSPRDFADMILQDLPGLREKVKSQATIDYEKMTKETEDRSDEQQQRIDNEKIQRLEDLLKHMKEEKFPPEAIELVQDKIDELR